MDFVRATDLSSYGRGMLQPSFLLLLETIEGLWMLMRSKPTKASRAISPEGTTSLLYTRLQLIARMTAT